MAIEASSAALGLLFFISVIFYALCCTTAASLGKVIICVSKTFQQNLDPENPAKV
tara:strand:+ start:301 stop:465 length:165 start_codon:yes stop_codon:yes gene_type:complete